MNKTLLTLSLILMSCFAIQVPTYAERLGVELEGKIRETFNKADKERVKSYSREWDMGPEEFEHFKKVLNTIREMQYRWHRDDFSSQERRDLALALEEAGVYLRQESWSYRVLLALNFYQHAQEVYKSADRETEADICFQAQIDIFGKLFNP